MTYSTGMVEPKEFFTEALIESKTLDLGLGFFSSSGIRSLAYGFALFIARGGKVRIIINNILSEADKKAIERGQQNLDIHFEEKCLQDIDKMIKTLSVEDEQFFNCLSYLISVHRVEFVATVSTKGGLGHDKYGIFTDEQGNKIAFIGSANFSSTALELNGETITVFNSWTEPLRVEEYQDLFNMSWETDNDHLTHVPFDSISTRLEDFFAPKTIQDLIKSGANLRGDKSFRSKPINVKGNLSPELIAKMEYMETEPRFPFPEERQIQIDAYNGWVNNNYRGLFAMATGSGKTVTALNCVLKRYRDIGYYKVIIAVPTQALALQWEKEAKNFNFQNIISTHTNPEWKSVLSRYTTLSMLNPQKNVVIITTYATFNRRDFQNFLSKTKSIDDFIYIADEAHNIGSPSSLKHLPEMIDYRIGLSATPERVYDEGGSKKMYDFFESYPPKYTYRFTMKDAIDQNILCHYDYHPVFIQLTPAEMTEYNRITDQLRKFIDPSTGRYSDDAEMLLLKRKRVIHKAENKKAAIAELLDRLNEQGKLNYAFVFVPEGYEPDYGSDDSYDIDKDDIHIIDEYANLFKERKYRYHKYISGLDDAPTILKNFADGDLQVLLSMKCLDEGVDIPRAEYAIFCSSTGNPRQFVQRRGRVLRRCKGKERAVIWDLIVTPPDFSGDKLSVERGLFLGEVKRIVNFAVLADNKIDILYGELKSLCESLGIPLFNMIDDEYKIYQ